MVFARMMAMALAAVGLSVGGFELGATRTPARDLDVPVEVPADHEIAAALDPSVTGSEISQEERVRLEKLAQEMDRARVQAERMAGVQTKANLEALRREMLRQQDEIVAARSRMLKQRSVTPEARRKVLARVQALRAVEAQSRAQAVQLQKHLAELEAQLVRQQEQSRRAQVEREYARVALQQMTADLQERVKAAVRSRREMDEERGFGLLLALRNRDDLGLTPAQVTKLQLLQAEFIQRFAPIRQAYEERIGMLGNGADGKPQKADSDKGTSTGAKESAANGGRVGTDPTRIYLFVDDKELRGQLDGLKKDIDHRAMLVLSETQRKQLQEIIDRSLAIGK